MHRLAMSLKETYFTSVKKTQILSFLRIKSCLTEKSIIGNPNFILEVLIAVCLTFDWVLKLIQISFQEEKLVQRCETKADADACKASY